jgi:hypothetical protein
MAGRKKIYPDGYYKSEEFYQKERERKRLYYSENKQLIKERKILT